MDNVLDFKTFKTKKAIQTSIEQLQPLAKAVRAAWVSLQSFAHYKDIKLKIFELQDIEDSIEKSILRKQMKLEEIERNSIDMTD